MPTRGHHFPGSTQLTNANRSKLHSASREIAMVRRGSLTVTASPCMAPSREDSPHGPNMSTDTDTSTGAILLPCQPLSQHALRLHGFPDLWSVVAFQRPGMTRDETDRSTGSYSVAIYSPHSDHPVHLQTVCDWSSTYRRPADVKLSAVNWTRHERRLLHKSDVSYGIRRKSRKPLAYQQHCSCQAMFG